MPRSRLVCVSLFLPNVGPIAIFSFLAPQKCLWTEYISFWCRATDWKDEYFPIITLNISLIQWPFDRTYSLVGVREIPNALMVVLVTSNRHWIESHVRRRCCVNVSRSTLLLKMICNVWPHWDQSHSWSMFKFIMPIHTLRYNIHHVTITLHPTTTTQIDINIFTIGCVKRIRVIDSRVVLLTKWFIYTDTT